MSNCRFPEIVTCDVQRIEYFERNAGDPEDQEIRLFDWLNK